MNEMRKLMEAVQLNEYLVRRGDKFDGLLNLNVYGDIAGEELFNEDYLDFAGDPAWQDVVADYKGHVLEQAKLIKEYAAKGRTLTSAEAEHAENTWYDGSDAYGSVEEAVEWLPGIFDAQLEAVEEILHGNIEGLHEEGIEEAYDDEVDGPNPFGSDEEVLRQLVRELQKLERNTARVYTEMTRSRMRADFSKFALNEFSETLTEITDLVEKYEDFG